MFGTWDRANATRQNHAARSSTLRKHIYVWRWIAAASSFHFCLMYLGRGR
jgi:hypothetical protein